MRDEGGQATIEWVGLMLLASVCLGAMTTVAPVIDGRSFGGFLSHRIVCAVRGSACTDRVDHQQLVGAYGRHAADRVRALAPDIVYEPGERSVPVDYRRCRSLDCSRSPDDRELDTHRTSGGQQPTVFTHVVRRGGRTYIQYWFYYPDSNSAVLGSDKAWRLMPRQISLGGLKLFRRPRYPGFHLDDWEGYQVRVDRDGSVDVRATAHGHYQWCKQARCHNRWGPRTGWTRVSRGSHAGHIPRARARERTTTAEGIRLVPIERLRTGRYLPLAPEVKPPWLKRVYDHPESGES
jgi:hypothetical protein